MSFTIGCRPTLGQFLSPDTIVPAAGNALDYHRYAYTRFNPVRYEDDSGHCATLANGQADENDADCWRLARTIGNLWNVTDYWRTRFGELDVWNNHVAPSGVNAEFMQSELSGYFESSEYHDWKAEWDRIHANDPIYDPMNDPILKAYSNYCMQGDHDCVGIMIDGIGFTSAVGVAAACIPGFAVCGTVAAVGGTIGFAASGVSVAWVATQATQGNATQEDVIVSAATFVIGGSGPAGSVIKPITSASLSLAASAAQLGWDFYGAELNVQRYSVPYE